MNGRFPLSDAEARRADVMRLTLQTAVPLWLERRRGWDEERLAERARECSQVFAAEGDNLMFKSPKKGAARVFNHLAEGMACALLLADGGMEFLGVRWFLDAGGRLRVGPVYDGT